MRLRRQFPFLLALITVIGFLRGLAQETPQTAPNEALPTFVLRVNPRWAESVNAVLKSIAHPLELTLPDGMKPEDLVRRLCAGHEIDAAVPIGDHKLRLSPCVNIRTGVQVTIHAGNTLEEIAVRNGLPPSVGPGLKVARPDSPRPVTPETMKPGDIVTIPEVPLWTDVIVKSDLIPDRKAMVAAIAAAVNCKQGDLDDCLHTRDVHVLEGAGAKHPPEQAPPPKRWPRPPEASKRGPGWRVLDPDGLRPVYNMYDSGARTPPVPAAPAPALRLPSTPITIPVAEGQWPYDAELLAEIFQDVQDSSLFRGIVGVADDGLADAAGAPLPSDSFDQSDGDAIGDGVQRNVNDPEAPQDVALCGGPVQPPFSRWAPAELEFSSHGSVVASLAGGLALRQGYPALSSKLPHVAFFRMSHNMCDPRSPFDLGEGEMVQAFDYLLGRTPIIVISYMKTTKGRSEFVDGVVRNLMYGEPIEPLLVLAAGDNGPLDLDKNRFAPQSLATIDSHTANRTIVVGAATRQLTRAGYSNFGERTVSLYAPGEPAGALNLAHTDGSTYKPATSYAAPQVAFAAAILHKFGYNSAIDVRDRLAAATWPLSGATQPSTGVVDLVKVAAVRHYAVEVIEHAKDGSPVRKTYVGKLKEKLGNLTVCDGTGFDEKDVQAIRFDSTGPDRRALLYQIKERDSDTQRRIIKEIPSCRSKGVLHLDALPAGSGLKTFPLTSVTEIQFPWHPGK